MAEYDDLTADQRIEIWWLWYDRVTIKRLAKSSTLLRG